jgi:hypothetical protein
VEELSRRSFLKGTGILGAGALTGAVLLACSPSSGNGDVSSDGSHDASAPPSGSTSAAYTDQSQGVLSWLPAEPSDPTNIEAEVSADIVIIGCGLAGTCAARSAAEDGASVIVIEKADGPQCRSGEYAVLDGEIMKTWNRSGIFDHDLIVDHEMDEMAYFPKRAVLSKWADGCGEVFDWFCAAVPDLYICPDSFTDIPDEHADLFLWPWYYPLPEAYHWEDEKYPTFPTSIAFGPDQTKIVQANWGVAESRGATAYWGHFAEKLIKDETKVVGCYARNAVTGGYIRVTANKGVILSTGEYSSNEDILSYYAPETIVNQVPHFFPNIDVEGNMVNTGDGLKMGAWINAAIQQHHPPMIHWMGVGGVGTAPYLRLNMLGKRFMNEDVPGQQVENQIECLPQKKFWEFWDSAWLDQVPFFQPQHGGPCYVRETPKNLVLSGASGFVTQADLDAAVEGGGMMGAVLKADTLDELLDLVGELDKETAKASIERYNKLAKDGKDLDFGKPASRMFPIENGPFYAASSGVSAMLVCPGGLVSDEDCHVYDNDDKIIPGLYAAGNIQGSRYAVAYPIALKGISHSLCMFYGYTAAKNAMAGV